MLALMTDGTFGPEHKVFLEPMEDRFQGDCGRVSSVNYLGRPFMLIVAEQEMMSN